MGNGIILFSFAWCVRCETSLKIQNFRGNRCNLIVQWSHSLNKYGLGGIMQGAIEEYSFDEIETLSEYINTLNSDD